MTDHHTLAVAAIICFFSVRPIVYILTLPYSRRLTSLFVREFIPMFLSGYKHLLWAVGLNPVYYDGFSYYGEEDKKIKEWGSFCGFMTGGLSSMALHVALIIYVSLVLTGAI